MPGHIKGSWTSDGLLASAAMKGFTFSNPEIPSLALSIAKLFSLSGIPVPWLGIIQDLCSFIFSGHGSDLEKGFDKSIIQNETIADYQDMVLGRWQNDDGLLRIQKAVSGRTLKRKAEAISHIFEYWIHAKFIEPLYANTGLIVALEANGFRLEKKATEYVEERGWPSELIKTVKNTGRTFRFAPQIIDSVLTEMIEKGFDAFDKAPKFQLRQILNLSNILQVTLTDRLFLYPTDHFIGSHKRKNSGQVPIGGYQSISTRGKHESLMPSQIIYFDWTLANSNLFELRHDSGELLYYKRAENNKIDTKHIHIFLSPSLVSARTKEMGLPCQTLTAVYSFINALWHNLGNNLEGLRAKLSISFVDWKTESFREIQVLEMLFSSDIELGIIKIDYLEKSQFQTFLKSARKSPNDDIFFIIRKPSDNFFCSIPFHECRDIIIQDTNLFLLGDSNLQEVMFPWPHGWAFTMNRLMEIIEKC